MRALRRSWQPRVAGLRPSAPRPSLLALGRGTHPRLAAVRAPESSPAAPLSLADIIAFESDMPSLLLQEPPPERAGGEQLVNRASRVLKEVSSLVEEQQPPAPGGEGSELSRAIFGGSAQVSEREGAARRQALQKTLEGPSASPAAAAAAAADAAAAEAATERPAWAEALFASAAAPPAAAPPAQSGSSRKGAGTPAPSTSRGGGGGGASKGSKPPAATPARGSPTLTRPAAPPPSGAGASSSNRSNGNGAGGAATAASPRPSSAPSAFSSSSSYSPSSAPSAGPSASASAPSPLPPALQPAPRKALPAWAPLAFAETDLSVPTELSLKSEEAMFAERARAAVLPPLQSVVDLTAAVRPPSRGLDLGAAAASEAAAEAVGVSEEEVVQKGAMGRRLADGAGRLADGTRFEKLSGVDTGPDGYVKKWEVLRGVTGDGTVQWEECWWQASNRFGLRELGAFKKGTTETGAAWVEEWKEVLHTHPTNLRLVIERSAHKWARDENADEWEEKWGECYEEAGRVHKYADKWAKAGINVWHERWGEDYDGRGACQKWTDKWAERLLPDGGQEQWGDKWTETFGDGKGTKHGEVWSSNSGGGRYNRWWNEEHFGNGAVRKWGNSNTGEYWDTVEHMDTYYNPVPHFGFKLAVGHSPQLWSVPLPPPAEGDGSGTDDDGLGDGLGRL